MRTIFGCVSSRLCRVSFFMSSRATTSRKSFSDRNFKATGRFSRASCASQTTAMPPPPSFRSSPPSCIPGVHAGTTKDMRMGFASRYVPTSVQVYPGTSVIEEYGGRVGLDRYGAVLVAGTDTYGHNRLVDRTTRDQPFRHRPGRGVQR